MEPIRIGLLPSPLQANIGHELIEHINLTMNSIEVINYKNVLETYLNPDKLNLQIETISREIKHQDLEKEHFFLTKNKDIKFPPPGRTYHQHQLILSLNKKKRY